MCPKSRLPSIFLLIIAARYFGCFRSDIWEQLLTNHCYVNEAITNPKSDLTAYDHLSVFSSHGSVDQVIPVTAARKVPAYLKNLGLDSKLREYPVGHGVAPQNFYDLKDWLLKH